jgi:outer membrane protein assembly factor BamB
MFCFRFQLGALLAVCACGGEPLAATNDWAQFLGPLRNGVYTGAPLAAQWPKDGPGVMWKQAVGRGFSGPVASGGRVVLFHRLRDKEVVDCLNAVDGRLLWRHEDRTAYEDDFGFDDGPRATPAVSGGRVYVLGAEGVARCLDDASGKLVWRVDAKAAFDAPKGFFGLACSPLVEGAGVYLNIGGRSGAGLVALDKDTGKLLWKATDHEASYSAPVAATLRGKRQVLFFTRAGLVAADPNSGRVLTEFPWRARMHASVNAAVPLVIEDTVFLSASYGVGAVLLSLSAEPPTVVWSGDDSLSNHYATSVYAGGYLYGFDGRQEQGQRLRCVELRTGKVRWSQEGLGAGTATLAGDRLLVLTERGELLAVRTAPDRFEVLDRAHVLSGGVRAYPAVADGRLYARSKDTLACLDLR